MQTRAFHTSPFLDTRRMHSQTEPNDVSRVSHQSVHCTPVAGLWQVVSAWSLTYNYYYCNGGLYRETVHSVLCEKIIKTKTIITRRQRSSIIFFWSTFTFFVGLKKKNAYFIWQIQNLVHVWLQTATQLKQRTRTIVHLIVNRFVD